MGLSVICFQEDTEPICWYLFMFFSKLFDSFMHFFYWFIGSFLLSCIYLWFICLPISSYWFLLLNMKLHLEKHHLLAYGKIAGGLRRSPEIEFLCWWWRNPKQPPFGCTKPVVNNGKFTISTGAGFLPPTVSFESGAHSPIIFAIKKTLLKGLISPSVPNVANRCGWFGAPFGKETPLATQRLPWSWGGKVFDSLIGRIPVR